MEKISKYSSLILGLLGIFMLGAYTDASVFGTREIETYRWFMTGGVSIFFLGIFLKNKNKKW